MPESIDAVLLLAGNPGPMTGDGTNTWLLDGAEPTLVDAGVGDPAHVRGLSEQLDGRPLARVLLTHGHSDHASGVAALRDTWPRVEICKWPSPEDARIRPLRDEATVRAGDRWLRVIHTPGHAPDHVCFWDSASGDLFAGDMIILGTTVVIPAGGGGSLTAYLRSLDRMAALGPRRILPGHGEIIDRPLDAIALYQRHRREREAQVRACLLDGVVSVDAIVARLYPGLSANVLPAARLTIQAHLDKLEEDERT